jgi:indolepyruvate ferredoxin oxidoreductase, alpha subunit
VTFVHERLKVERRMPAAQAFIRERKLNEIIPGDLDDVGVIVMGGLTNGLLRALERVGLADAFGTSRAPILVLNVVYPLVPEELRAFCAGKRAVLVVEEGHPEYIAQAVNVELRRADMTTRVLGKGALPKAGEYTADVLLEGLAAFLTATRPAGIDADAIAERVHGILGRRARVAAALGELPTRPPAFCTGCPERPVFSALKLVQRELGPTHISADIGCHSFATMPPFGMGNSILGYGMSLASAAAVGPNMAKRPIAVMGDGGFWHNGLITGVASNLFNKGDGVLVIMQNGYTSKMGGKPGDPVAIVEFLKPGIEEFCELLPPRLATAILGAAHRRGWIDRFHWGMEVRTTSITGYLRFLLLAKLKRFRGHTYRYRSRWRSKPGSP